MAKPRKNGKGGKRKAQDKDDTVETRSPEIAGLEIADDDFDLHLASVKRAVDAMKKAKNGYDACCKGAKKVSPALLDAIKLAVKLEGQDLEDIKRTLEISGYVLRKTNSPIQLTVHDALLGDVTEAAYKRGHDAGSNGRAMACPYPENSDLADAYGAGWRNGTGGNLGLTEQETEAAVSGDRSGLGHNSVNAAAE